MVAVANPAAVFAQLASHQRANGNSVGSSTEPIVQFADAGAKNIPRYTKTLIANYVEYKAATCTQVDTGSWALDTAPKYGTVSFGTRTGHLADGTCPNVLFTFAALSYTWTAHNNNSKTDSFGATYNSQSFHVPFTYPVAVPVVVPDLETTATKGWDVQGIGLWTQTLSNKSDPSFDWSSDTVRETDPGTGKVTNDTCWCPGAAFDPFWNITGGTWPISATGVWGFDHVGWCSAHGPDFCSNTKAPLPVQYYRKKSRAPCGTTFPQQMQFQATKIAKNWVKYGPVNTLGGSFTYTAVTSKRAGKAQTHTVTPQPVKTRIACSVFKPMPPPAAQVATFGSSVSVNDPRPVAAAIEEIERVSGKPITYEDPPFEYKYHVMPMVATTSGDSSLLVPKGGILRFRLPTNASAAQTILAVRDMVETYNAGRSVVTYSLSQNSLTHVVPNQVANARGRLVPVMPVLDSKITIEAKPRSMIQLLDAICQAVSQASGYPVGLGTVPTGLLRRPIEFGASNQSAREVLEKLILATGEPLSWRLLYDPGVKAYYLNIPKIK